MILIQIDRITSDMSSLVNRNQCAPMNLFHADCAAHIRDYSMCFVCGGKHFKNECSLRDIYQEAPGGTWGFRCVIHDQHLGLIATRAKTVSYGAVCGHQLTQCVFRVCGYCGEYVDKSDKASYINPSPADCFLCNGAHGKQRGLELYTHGVRYCFACGCNYNDADDGGSVAALIANEPVRLVNVDVMNMIAFLKINSLNGNNVELVAKTNALFTAAVDSYKRALCIVNNAQRSSRFKRLWPNTRGDEKTHRSITFVGTSMSTDANEMYDAPEFTVVGNDSYPTEHVDETLLSDLTVLQIVSILHGKSTGAYGKKVTTMKSIINMKNDILMAFRIACWCFTLSLSVENLEILLFPAVQRALIDVLVERNVTYNFFGRICRAVNAVQDVAYGASRTVSTYFARIRQAASANFEVNTGEKRVLTIGDRYVCVPRLIFSIVNKVLRDPNDAAITLFFLCVFCVRSHFLRMVTATKYEEMVRAAKGDRESNRKIEREGSINFISARCNEIVFYRRRDKNNMDPAWFVIERYEIRI